MVLTLPDFARKKAAGEKIVMATCYDYTSASIMNKTSVDCLLVGDSLAMTMHGFRDTLSATVDMMAMHVAAVARGARDKFIIADMPFLSYRGSLTDNVAAAGALMRAGAHAVKLEGEDGNIEFVRHLIQSGVPVMGHLGLTPQSVHQLGGYKVQGKSEATARRILEDAQRLDGAGCFALVLECVPADVAANVAQKTGLVTIGIGAGAETDGQVLVFQDMLGMNNEFMPKFVKRYMEGADLIAKAMETYAEEVRQKKFPGPEHRY